MPDNWSADNYRNRARMWREKADALPEGKEREACLALAEGYANLAGLVDEAGGQQNRVSRTA
jgi:hypothetical protein